jgi:uridine kinase
MALRDGSHPDPDHPSMRRYVEGQRIYLARCLPAERATAVIDNTDVHAPRVVRAQPTR